MTDPLSTPAAAPQPAAAPSAVSAEGSHDGRLPDAAAQPAGGISSEPAKPTVDHGYVFEGRPVPDAWGSSLKAVNASPRAVDTLLSWAREIHGKAPPVEKQEHVYDTRNFRLSPDDRALANSFMNRAAKAGLELSEVAALVEWYSGGKWNAETAQKPAQQPKAKASAEPSDADLARWDAEDQRKALDTLRAEWGPNYRGNWAMIKRYVESLPQAERDALLSEVKPDGVLKMHDPFELRKLLERARVPASTSSGTHPAERKAQLLTMLHTDRSAYNRDADAQRELMALNGQAVSERPIPSNPAAIDAEIADLHKLMRTNRAEYNRRGAARLLQLNRARHG